MESGGELQKVWNILGGFWMKTTSQLFMILNALPRKISKSLFTPTTTKSSPTEWRDLEADVDPNAYGDLNE